MFIPIEEGEFSIGRNATVLHLVTKNAAESGTDRL